jgi:hypothetical protein
MDVHASAMLETNPDSLCRRSASDVVECSPYLAFGFGLTPRYRFAEHWAVGVFGSWSSVSEAYDSSLCTAGADGRYLFLGAGGAEPYLGARVGVGLLADRVPAGELGEGADFTRALPTGGASIGIDFRVFRWFVIGPELGATLFVFGGNSDEFAVPADYLTLAAARLAVNVGWARN